MGQHAATTGVKFRPGSPSIPGERVASGLVWRFGTLDCVSDNLACFEDGFGSGSFLDVGSHCFYVAKPFPEEVTDVLDPLSDGGSSCSESCEFSAMVKVMALEVMARRSNAFLCRSRTLHSQSRTPRTSPSWTCTHRSTASSTPPRLRRPWCRGDDPR
jgi:hypothetical protein